MWGDGGAYAAWSNYLETWQSDLQTWPADQLPALEERDFSGPTWARLSNRIVDALSARLSLWSTALSGALREATSEFTVGRALAQARTGLLTVLQLTDHPGLPADLRERLRGLVEREIRTAQKQLEQQVDDMERDGASRAEAEARRRTVRDNPLTAVLSAAPAVPGPAAGGPAGDGWAYDPTAPTRRRFALD